MSNYRGAEVFALFSVTAGSFQTEHNVSRFLSAISTAAEQGQQAIPLLRLQFCQSGCVKVLSIFWSRSCFFGQSSAVCAFCCHSATADATTATAATTTPAAADATGRCSTRFAICLFQRRRRRRDSGISDR